jgi:hypothetical protein
MKGRFRRSPAPPLPQGMLDDMTFRNMSPNAMKIYSAAVANFSAFHADRRTSSASRRCVVTPRYRPKAVAPCCPPVPPNGFSPPQG